MITPILFSNTGLKNSPMVLQNVNANNHAQHVRGGGGPQQGSLINFSGVDIFIKKSDKFSTLVDGINTKIQTQLCAYTPQKLERDIQTVMKEVPEASEQEILSVMQRLTQWANYSCLPHLAHKLVNLNVSEIANNSPLNRCFNYLHRSKTLFELSPNSGNIAYLMSKSELAQTVERKHPQNTIFVNLEGFEDGVNLFTADNRLAERTAITLKKVQGFRYLYPDKTFKEALFTILNGRIRKEMSSYGYNVKTVCRHQPATRETILAQMQPVAPNSPEKIKTTIETIAEFYSDSPEQYAKLKTYIADYYACKLNVFSKQSIIEDLDKIKNQIDKYLDKHKIPERNVHYVIPDELGHNKSFGLITYMFAQQHNIEPKKILRLKNISDLDSYPENNIFVILDDFSGSGDTLTQACNYHFDSFCLKKKQQILFCPLSACESAVDNINAMIDISSREKFDKLITLDKNVQRYPTSDKDISIEKFFMMDPKGIEVLGYEGYRRENYFAGCTVFPYMAPDNNSNLASFLHRYFLPSTSAMKNIHTDFDKIVPQIDKNVKIYE